MVTHLEKNIKMKAHYGCPQEKKKNEAHVKIKPNLTVSWRWLHFLFRGKTNKLIFWSLLRNSELTQKFLYQVKTTSVILKLNHSSSSSAPSVPWHAVVDPLPARCSCCSGHAVHLAAGSRALIEQIWAWLELRVRVFCLRVSVLSVHATAKGQWPTVGKHFTLTAFLLCEPADAGFKWVLCQRDSLFNDVRRLMPVNKERLDWECLNTDTCYSGLEMIGWTLKLRYECMD